VTEVLLVQLSCVGASSVRGHLLPHVLHAAVTQALQWGVLTMCVTHAMQASS
jgi:hypothetical protein